MKHEEQLINAIKQLSLAGVQSALAMGANPNAYFNNYSALGWLHESCGLLIEHENPTWLAILKTLLDAGADPNQSIERDNEYLINALSQFSHLSAMRILLDYGANPNFVTEGFTALGILKFDHSYEETCNLPDWYKGRVLPEYETPENLEDNRIEDAIWLVSRHQRGYAMLRQAGGLLDWELRETPLAETLALYPDRLGGMYTDNARPDQSFQSVLGHTLSERIARWAHDYIDPNQWGYGSTKVQAFDYKKHLDEGLSIGQAIAPLLPEGITLELLMPTSESIAAQSDMFDVYKWDFNHQAWTHHTHWRDKLSPDWFAAEPAGLHHLKLKT